MKRYYQDNRSQSGDGDGAPRAPVSSSKILAVLCMVFAVIGLHAHISTSVTLGTDHAITPRSISLTDRPLKRLLEQTRITFVTTHKMGYVMTKKFMQTHLKDASKTFQEDFKPNANGEQIVAVVRDMFDATVSGYLYHKTGRECWLDRNGNSNAKSGRDNWANRFRWMNQLKTVPVPKQYSKLNGRFPEYNLCNVLNATNETVGMGIYLEMARNKYYKPIPKLKNNTDDSQVLWVCFEDMRNDPVGTENRIRDRFLPNSTSTQNSPSRRLGGGGHSTNPDPVLRKRLHAIARELDCKYFGCTTKLWNDALGCKSSIQTDNTTTVLETVSSNAQPDSSNNHPAIQPGSSNAESSSNKLKGNNTENDLYGRMMPSVSFQRLVTAIIVGALIGIHCIKMMRPLRMSRRFRETAV